MTTSYRITLSGIFGAVVLSVAVSPSKATPITIVNPSFEDFVPLADGDFTVAFDLGGANPHQVVTADPIPGWTVPTSGTGAGTFNPPTDFSGTVVYPGEAQEGQNIAFANPDNTISQVLSDVLTENIAYTLLVEIGNRADHAEHDYAVELRAGGVKLAEDFNSISPADGTFATSTVLFNSLPG